MMAHPFKRSIGPTIAINTKLLWAVLFGLAAWVLWPSSYEWWGFGLLSIIMCAASVLSLIGALKAMVALHARDKMIAEYEALGTAPKSSRMATEDELRDAGMFHG